MCDVDPDAFPEWYQEGAEEEAGPVSTPQRFRPAAIPALRDLDVAETNSAEAAPKLLTIGEAAERLTVKRCTMQALLLSGEVRSFKIGSLRRIPPEALNEYIARRMQP